AVKVTYDPSKITPGQLLRVFFAVSHDPTQLNRQGPDVGTQYRSAIFFATPQQEEIANAYIAQLGAKLVFPKPIVTKVEALKAFYAAEPHHQDYVERHPESGYVVAHDLPKLARLKKEFPALYVK
ncbi:MAG: peptide-methionine (S)-S-oxide reductase MsrA, partial [Bdellovibrionales bacterium]